jgi:hypothetical protein
MIETLNNPLIQLLLITVGVGVLAWLNNRRAQQLRAAGQVIPSAWRRVLAGLGFVATGDDTASAPPPGKIVLQLTPEQLAELRAAYNAYLARPAGNQGLGRTETTRPLAPRDWLAIVNDRPDDAPHTLVVGPTGVGKTTFAQAIAVEREGKVAILDPKWKPGKWGGAPAVPIDDDGRYTQIEAAIQSLLAELNGRLVAMKRGQTDFEPLTIIAEELPTLVDECGSAPMLFKQMGRLGRELRIRLIGLSQSERVKSLGIEGEGDAKDNYAIIRLGKAASAVLPALRSVPRPAALEWHGEQHALDVMGVVELTARPISSARWWQLTERCAGPRTKETPGNGAETRFGPRNESVTASECDVTSDSDVPDLVVTTPEAAVIAVKLAQGVTPSDIAKSLPGYTPRKYNLFKAKVDTVREALETADK